MEEDFENRVIEDLPVVSSVRFHVGDKTHEAGVYDNLRCSEASWYGVCDAQQVGTIRISSKYGLVEDTGTSVHGKD